jgi:hypothetical protein
MSQYNAPHSDAPADRPDLERLQAQLEGSKAPKYISNATTPRLIDRPQFSSVPNTPPEEQPGYSQVGPKRDTTFSHTPANTGGPESAESAPKGVLERIGDWIKS